MSAVEFEPLNWRSGWLCEKWSEEAVDFARRKLTALGITHLPGHVTPVKQLTVRERIAERIAGRELFLPKAKTVLVPISAGVTSAALRKYVGEAEEVVEMQGNLLLNEGIQQMIDLTIAAISNQTAANAYGNTNAYTGVGDSSTAEAATQTDLQAATNHFYKAMNATYPSRASQTVSFQSDFTSTEANYAWAEWSIAAGATSASGSGFLLGTKNLNRKVSSLGTKSTGTWTLTSQITIS